MLFGFLCKLCTEVPCVHVIMYVCIYVCVWSRLYACVSGGGGGVAS